MKERSDSNWVSAFEVMQYEEIGYKYNGECIKEITLFDTE